MRIGVESVLGAHDLALFLMNREIPKGEETPGLVRAMGSRVPNYYCTYLL
jgi:hypothetical protein